MTVKEASKLLKIPVSSLHYYENEKLIKPKRNKNNYRIFDKEDIMKIKCILILKNFNFSIAKIRELVTLYETCSSSNKSRTMAGRIFEEQINELERKKEEYTNLINLFKMILLFEEPKAGEEKETDKLIEKIYNTCIGKEGI